jgi:DNA excision repair protein ERCC-8
MSKEKRPFMLHCCNLYIPSRCVDEYEFSGIVYQHDLSPVATKHCLIAVGCQSSKLKLVDLKSGSNTHMLKGHRSSIYCVKWSPKEEFILASYQY